MALSPCGMSGVYSRLNRCLLGWVRAEMRIINFYLPFSALQNDEVLSASHRIPPLKKIVGTQ